MVFSIALFWDVLQLRVTLMSGHRRLWPSVWRVVLMYFEWFLILFFVRILLVYLRNLNFVETSCWIIFFFLVDRWLRVENLVYILVFSVVLLVVHAHVLLFSIWCWKVYRFWIMVAIFAPEPWELQLLLHLSSILLLLSVEDLVKNLIKDLVAGIVFVLTLKLLWSLLVIGDEVGRHALCGRVGSFLVDVKIWKFKLLLWFLAVCVPLIGPELWTDSSQVLSRVCVRFSIVLSGICLLWQLPVYQLVDYRYLRGDVVQFLLRCQ